MGDAVDCVPCSDDENYGFTQNEITGDWEPPAQVIVDLYTRLSKDEKLELEWKCPGRRPPTPEEKENSTTEDKQQLTNQDEEKLEPTEFDFDDLSAETNPITPRRTPGNSKTPASKKRVARLDKIMDDIFRHKKINQLDKTGASGASPVRASGNSPIRASPGRTGSSPGRIDNMRQSPRASPRGSPKPSVGGESPRPKMSPKKL